MNHVLSKEKHSDFEFGLLEINRTEGFGYEIYTRDNVYISWNKTNVLRKSNIYFKNEQEARCAAIEHIELLENENGAC